MLRATRRLLRPGGRTAFTTIHLPADLSSRQRRRAREAGPPAVETRSRDYVTLLTSAGFVDVDHIDVTADYRRAQGRWLQHAHAMEDELAPTERPGRFAERIEEELATREALGDGLLRRGLFLARRLPRRNADVR